MKYLFLILPFFTQAQTVDSLQTKAYTGTFLPIQIVGLAYLQNGLTSNGHVWMAGFNLRYSGNTALPVQVVRVDCTTGITTTKIIDSIFSSTSMLWRNAFDSSGNLYLGLNSANRRVWRFNFKDSIYAKNLGNGFNDGNSLCYSLYLGRDRHIYGGASSGSTCWFDYDPALDVLTKHPQISADQDYVLSIQGDPLWIYAIVGQRNRDTLYAIRKSDNYKKVITSCPSSTAIGLRAHKDGIYWTDSLINYYRITDTTSTLITSFTDLIEYYETTEDLNVGPKPGYKIVTSFYNSAGSQLMFNIDNVGNSVSIPSTNVLSTVRRIYATDTGHVYYFGEYYGYAYLNDSAHKLGYIGFNVYSWVQYNDSIIYIGGYPSGVTAKYNKNQPWTAETFYNGSMHHLSTTTNPKLITYFRSNTPAGFLTNNKMIKTTDNYVVSVGPVERTQSTSSVGVIYNDSAYGYDCNKMPIGMVIQDVAQWRDKVVISTLNTTSAGCKLYVYDYRGNVMTDSTSLNYTDYGNIYIVGDKLLGIANNVIYNYNLAQKVLVNSHSYSAGAITFSYMMPDGRILIKSTGTLPNDMCYQFVAYSGTQGISTVADKLYTLTSDAVQGLRLNDYFRTDCGPQNPVMIANMISNRLGLPLQRVNASIISINTP